ncbi:hypothetical protein KAR02_03310 [Candidatus Bipolaricaulota bacterium]|nr:hypothetical protein [Candidatus Bipolaricaulota bacterium]
MVTKKERNGKGYYVCDLCGVAYTEEEWAKKCTEWCAENPGTCSIEVSQYAVRLEDSPPLDD